MRKLASSRCQVNATKSSFEIKRVIRVWLHGSGVLNSQSVGSHMSVGSLS